VSRDEWRDYVRALKLKTAWSGVLSIGFTRMLAPAVRGPCGCAAARFEEITQSDQPNLILAGGIAFSLMLFALIHMQALHGRRMEQIAHELEQRHDALRPPRNMRAASSRPASTPS
jgi:hypothetical protein